METVGRAQGKVILVGEHAVVYGVPAIALGIDRGAVADARPTKGESTLEVRLAGAEPIRVLEGEEAEPLGRAFTALMKSARSAHDVGTVAVEVSTDLPAGAGLGCSAALGVAIARALGASNDDEVREHAMEWERVFHGNPSGIDAAVAALGGTLLFQWRDDETHIEPVSLPGAAPLVVVVGHSGSASSTKTMVESVARQQAANPKLAQKTFDAIGAIVRNARLAIEAGDLEALGKLLDMNQMLLAGLLLSTQEIEAMCACARVAGALGAKLTGAGGGGCVIALADSTASAERILAAWRGEGRTAFIAEARSDSKGRVGPPEGRTAEAQP